VLNILEKSGFFGPAACCVSPDDARVRILASWLMYELLELILLIVMIHLLEMVVRTLFP